MGDPKTWSGGMVERQDGRTAENLKSKRDEMMERRKVTRNPKNWIWGNFRPFRRSFIPSFRISGHFPPSAILLLRHSIIPSFHHSIIPSFHHSIIPSFHHSSIPIFRVARSLPDLSDLNSLTRV